LDPATRTFMGLRIHVNDELEELRRGLGAAEQLLAPDGRLAVISFHSLEDRIVKTFLHQRSDKSAGVSRHLPEAPTWPPSFRLIKRGAIKPADAETQINPRARSARLRTAIRTDAPAWAEAA
jgi:16S rRNA (cytosine1402-N4)-methyltransferase